MKGKKTAEAPLSQPEEPVDEILERVKNIESHVVPTRVGQVAHVMKSVAKATAFILAIGGSIIAWKYIQVKRAEAIQCLEQVEEDTIRRAEELNAAAKHLTSCQGNETCEQAFERFKAVNEERHETVRDTNDCLQKLIPSSLGDL